MPLSDRQEKGEAFLVGGEAEVRLVVRGKSGWCIAKKVT